MKFKKALSIIMSAVIAVATSGVFNVAAPQSITAVAANTKYTSWQEGYKATLTEYMTSETFDEAFAKYELYDVDSNGTPELFISAGEAHMSELYIYTFANNKVVDLFEGSINGAYGSAYIVPTNKYIYFKGGNQGWDWTRVYQLNGDKITQVATLTDTTFAVSADYYGYKYNDTKITKSQYDSYLKQYTSDSLNGIGREKSFDGLYSDEAFAKNYSSWQEGYKEELSRIDSPNSYTYGIMDINADGIPELMVQSSSAVMPSYLYTFYRNKVIRLMGLEKGGSVSYCKADNTCLAKGGSAGYVYYRTFKIQNGNAQKIDDVFWDTGNTYTLNDKSITQSQYQTWQSNNIASKTWKEFDCISFNEMNSKLAAMMPVTTTTTKPTTTTTTTTRTTTKTSPVTTTTTTPYNVLKLSTDKITLKAGEQYTISANQTNLTYSSNNKSVAIVSSSGIITALSDGEAIISVYNSNYDVAQIRVTVDSNSSTLPTTTTRTTTTATTTTTTTTTTATTTKIVDSGTCGDNLTWALNNEGTLTISGTGKMDDFFRYNQVPWYSSRYAIKNVTIENGVTSIGNFAFNCCENLKSIKIPDSVTSIGNYAFYGCSSLTSITIPDSVTSIGNYAFSDCSSLTSITIPDSVTSIGNRAFDGCSSLKSITIPDSVTSIGYFAFESCSRLQSITIPDSVTSIEDSAFSYCHNLTSITIPDSVTSIGRGAFIGCSRLQSITIPDSVTSIGKEVFVGCSSLTSITIPDSVTSIGNDAFSGCSSNLTIKGYKDSYAEKYAKEHNIKFEIYDESAATTTSETNVIGDANLDGRVTVADAVAILQFIANKDKYNLNSQARKNADCFNVGDGITGKDALAIQRLDAKVIAKLPYNE